MFDGLLAKLKERPSAFGANVVSVGFFFPFMYSTII